MSEPTVSEIPLTEARRRTRRSFIAGGLAAIAGIWGWYWARHAGDADDIPWPFRKVLRLNEKIWRGYFRPTRTAPAPAAPVVGTPPRVNGLIGLDEVPDADPWSLEVGGQTLSLEDLRRLPRCEQTCLFKCIEGWSAPVAYAGVRFSDFLQAYGLGRRAEGGWYSVVGLETPDAEYYVSIDMESMLHSQTVLAYEMNGRPLSRKNGAPLRLVIPVKYGIKSLKRVGSIQFSDQRLPDYWAERGYDWYSGL